jgi:hypothetical protein
MASRPAGSVAAGRMGPVVAEAGPASTGLAPAAAHRHIAPIAPIAPTPPERRAPRQPARHPTHPLTPHPGGLSAGTVRREGGVGQRWASR